MEKIFKGSDLVFNIKLEDKNGVPYRVGDTDSFVIEFFTNCGNKIVCSFDGETYTNIIPQDRIDQIIINDEDLSTLDSGVICYSYAIKINSNLFKDAAYDEVVKGQTDFYLI